MDQKCFVRQKYEIQKLIAKGSFGQIYIGENIITHQKVAIKFEPMNIEEQNNDKNKNIQYDFERKMNKNTTLNYKYYLEQIKPKQQQTQKQVLIYECRALRCLNGALGFPQIHWYGIHSDFNSYALVMDLLDISISDLFKKQHSLKNKFDYKSRPISEKQDITNCNHFSLKTVLMIADQMISRLEFLHKKGFIHCDIKPENMLLGRGYNSNVIYLIDFGLSKRYIDEKGNHIDYGESNIVCGTARYMSINGHLGINLSRRDDMESLGYVLIYLLKGSLPWQGLASKKTPSKIKRKSSNNRISPAINNCEINQNQREKDALSQNSKIKNSQNDFCQPNFNSNSIPKRKENGLNFALENHTNIKSEQLTLDENGEDINEKANLYNKIAEIKLKTPIQVLCEGIPEEFQIYLQQVRTLRFEDEPDYSFYKQLFKSLLIQSGYTYDSKFDWSL